MLHPFAAALTDLLADADTAGISIRTDYTSATPTVTPPAGSYRADGKVIGQFQLPDGRPAATIDSWGSQFSRMEALIPQVAESVSYPLVILATQDGSHSVSSAELSHRQADATWRLAEAELKAAGIPFDAIQGASPACALPLLRWFPSAIPGGWWHSHSKPTTAGKKSQDRLKKLTSATGDEKTASLLGDYVLPIQESRAARLFVAEIIAAGISERRRHAGRIDSLFGPVGMFPKSRVKASEAGIGSLPPVRDENAPSDLTFEDLYGTAHFSLSALRRYEFTDRETGEQVDFSVGGPLVVALTLLLYRMLQQNLDLRAGTSLIVAPNGFRATVQRHGMEPEQLEIPEVDELVTIVRDLGAEAGWQGPKLVTIPDSSPLGKLLKTVESDDGETPGGDS